MEYILEDIEYCEPDGYFENEYVYDIEVDDDTHTFIANDILVHNSLYVTYSPMMKSINYQGDELKFILHMDSVFVKNLFKDYLNDYANKYGVENIHDFELETINKSGLHLQKKHYINNVVYEDGVFYDDLSHYYPKGIDIVKSSTPLFVRENIWDFINYLFKNPDNLNIKEILKIIKNIKSKFLLSDIEDISLTTSCSKYEEKVIDDQENLITIKGAHFGVKAAAFHNYLLNKNSEYKSKYDLIRGGKIKYYYCKHETNDRFGYLRNFYPIEIVEKEGVKVDYDLLFEKTFLTIVNRFLEPIGLPKVNKRLSVLNGIFSFKKNKQKELPEKEEENIDDNDEFDFF